MPPVSSGECPLPTDSDSSVFSRYLTSYDEAYRESLKQSAESTLAIKLLDLYGTSDYADVVSIWLEDPAATTVQLTSLDPNWGLTHAVQLLILLKSLSDGGANNEFLSSKYREEVERYYVREARARCAGAGTTGPIAEWLNPSLWGEDSMLDYYSPLLFGKWFIDNL